MPFAIKLQAYIGDRPSADLRGGEPQDQHWTVAEADPVADDELELALTGCTQINNLLSRLVPSKSLPGEFSHAGLGVFVMDSDGRR